MRKMTGRQLGKQKGKKKRKNKDNPHTMPLLSKAVRENALWTTTEPKKKTPQKIKINK